jgi:hypothetical protein
VKSIWFWLVANRFFKHFGFCLEHFGESTPKAQNKAKNAHELVTVISEVTARPTYFTNRLRNARLATIRNLSECFCSKADFYYIDALSPSKPLFCRKFEQTSVHYFLYVSYETTASAPFFVILFSVAHFNNLLLCEHTQQFPFTGFTRSLIVHLQLSISFELFHGFSWDPHSDCSFEWSCLLLKCFVEKKASQPDSQKSFDATVRKDLLFFTIFKMIQKQFLFRDWGVPSILPGVIYDYEKGMRCQWVLQESKQKGKGNAGTGNL